MKTKEIIKLLKEEDPSGETHVRVEGGIITFFEMKEGYWDGGYSYIDDDGNFIITSTGTKIDMHTMDYEDFIYINHGDYSKIKLNFSDCADKNQMKEKEDSYLKEFKRISENYKRHEKQTVREFTYDVLQRLKDGWKIMQEKNTTPTMMTIKYMKENKTDGVMGGEFETIIKSGLFKPTEKEDYIYWELNINIK